MRLPPEPGHPARPRLNAVTGEMASPGSGGPLPYQEHLNLLKFMKIMENHVLQGNSNRLPITWWTRPFAWTLLTKFDVSVHVGRRQKAFWGDRNLPDDRQRPDTPSRG
jgi:hypothetical protein